MRQGSSCTTTPCGWSLAITWPQMCGSSYEDRWGGEFGRTVYSQGTLTKENYGRDHHPRNFCMWLAGGGIKGGVTYGETDDFSYNVVANPCHINDLNATLLHCLGIDHERFSFKFQGLD